ncbi:hypothetical protein [Rubrobacter indicoceani]|uniref:hypothetical protein n=1 Tax=Rubrobacter indicoceani TaxID=2051957 RepID=UPI000E5AA508|nr:hypothetical protein [Rubrobacter indicoceani]
MPGEGRRGISGFVSDLDGTLLETEELRALSHARAVRELRPEVTEGRERIAGGCWIMVSPVGG